MINKDLNRYSDDNRRQDDDEFDISDNDQENTPLGSLDDEVRKICRNLRRAAFESCKCDIELEDTLFISIWEQVRGIVRKPLFREVVIIAAILLLKNGLYEVYRLARKEGLEIGNL